MWRLGKKITLNHNQEMDFALLLKAQAADENQSGLTLRKKLVETYLLSIFLLNSPHDLF